MRGRKIRMPTCAFFLMQCRRILMYIDLEISKPQKNTRSGPPVTETQTQSKRRSPENVRSSGPRKGSQNKLPVTDFRDETAPRRWNDYRAPRSPSPRGFRGRNGGRDRNNNSPLPPGRRDRWERRRSRSPQARDRRFRSPSPQPRSAYESDADLPVPRRSPKDVPDVQILVLDNVDRLVRLSFFSLCSISLSLFLLRQHRNFVFYVEDVFRRRGFRVADLTLGPRIPLAAAVYRQVSEGVQAIVKLSRSDQVLGKVTLQLVDRSGGMNNLRLNGELGTP